MLRQAWLFGAFDCYVGHKQDNLRNLLAHRLHNSLCSAHYDKDTT